MQLPAAAGGSVQLRWRFGSDSSYGGIGWYVDSITLSAFSYDWHALLLVNPRLVPPAALPFSYYALTGYNYVVEAFALASRTAGFRCKPMPAIASCNLLHQLHSRRPATLLPGARQ